MPKLSFVRTYFSWTFTVKKCRYSVHAFYLQ